MALDKPFINLHNHTDYSLLDGMQSIKEVAAFAAKDGQPAAAITDHGNMSGYLKFEQACHAAGINPIPGIEAYHVEDFAATLANKEGRRRNHMLLLGVNETGLLNLMRASSKAYTEQFYYKPLFDDALLASHSKGLVGTSGCLASPIGRAIQDQNIPRARDLLARYRDIFDPGRFFVEIQVHDFPEQRAATRELLRLAKDLGIPLLAGQDAHYASPMMARAHEKMLAMQTKSLLSDPNRFKFSSHTNFMLTSDQARMMFPEDSFPGAYANTYLVSEMARDVPRQAGVRYLIPSFPEAESYGGEQAMLRAKVTEGVRARYGDDYSDEVAARMNFELDVIHRMGFDAYFLIVWDVVDWARRQGIRVGPGRGSAAGSLCAYALGITQLCPLTHGLYFERFLNPGRKELPDIDIDFERDRRHEVRLYVRDKYGSDRVAYVATEGVFHGRSAVKSACRIHGVLPKVTDAVASTVPMHTKLTIRQLLGEQSELPKISDPAKDQEQRDMWEAGERFRHAVSRGGATIAEAVGTAAEVEGYIQGFGVHAAGVLITPGPLTDFVPLTTETKDKSLVVCAYDKLDVEAVGGLKMDFLGLVNLTTINDTLEQIKANTGREIDTESLPLDDRKTFALLQRADTTAVFQLGSSGMKDLLRRVYPTRFEDLSAVLALYRPGPMGTDMHWAYADRKNGRERITVEHADMMEILGETAGVLAYQEQLIALAQKFAGFTAAEADTLRKATGKKNAELLAAQEVKFKAGVVAQGYTEKLANQLWEKIPSFAAYSFNKSHSAAYAKIAYETAYLKAHFPAEYAAACVNTLSNPPEHIQWARASGIEFDVPDVNQSLLLARAFAGRVRLGLLGVKGVGMTAAEAIVTERQLRGEYRSVADFLVRSGQTGKINKLVVTALVEAGAFDSLSASRGALIAELPALIERAKTQQKTKVSAVGMSLLDDFDLDTPLADLKFDAKQTESLPLSARISAQVERLGVFLSPHPMELFARHLASRIPSGAFRVSESLRLGACTVYGAISRIESKPTARSRITTITIEAHDGYAIQAKVFGETPELEGVKLGSLLIASGVLQEDEWGSSGDDDTGDGLRTDAPREFLINEMRVVPLSVLDRVAEKQGLLITLSAGDRLPELARVLTARVTQGATAIYVQAGPGEPVLLPFGVEQDEQALLEILGDFDVSVVPY